MSEAHGQRPDKPLEPREALALFETGPHGVVAVDAKGRIAGMDEAAAEIFGWKAEDVTGHPLTDLIPAARAGLDAPPRGSPPRLGRVGGRRRDGTRIGLEVVLARNGGGEVDLVVAVRELAPESATAEHARRASSMDLLGRYSAKVAHDLKNHLMAVGGYCELAMGRIDSDPQRARQMLEQTLDATERARDYLEAIHALGRGRPDEVEPFEVAPLVSSLAPGLVSLLPAGVRLEVETENADGQAELSRDALRHALKVLVENAGEAISGEGRVMVRTGTRLVTAPESLPDLPPGRYVTIEVEDTGRGVDDALRARLFEPFLRTGRERGRGLGLATVYALCRQLGGGVTVRSQVGHGTTVRLHFPRLDKHARSESPEGRSPSRAPSAPGASRTVLVVDDLAAVRDIVKDALEDAGYRVMVAASGPEALGLLSNGGGEGVDLLLTDVLMPGMNGPELAEKVGASHPALPVLFMSAYARDVLPRGSEGRLVSFIAKPFTPRDLATKVGAVLATGAA